MKITTRVALHILSFFFCTLGFARTGDKVRRCLPGHATQGEYLVRHRIGQGLTLHSFRRLAAKRILFEPASWFQPAATLAQTLSLEPVVSPDPTLALLADQTPEAMAALAQDADVLSVQENCLIHISAVTLPRARTPNDLNYPRQWGHTLAHDPDAWAATTGGSKVVVAVLDTGVDIYHEDLRANIWTNAAEINGQPQVDDDKNGYVDDVHGYNFALRDGDPRPNNGPEMEHGTHVAGIIGAVGNNKIGISGVNWHLQMMALRAFDDQGNASLASLLEGVYYAVNNGARVINCSWGARQQASEAEVQAFAFAVSKGVLPIAAAGNDGEDGINFTPGSLNNVLAIGAITRDSKLSSFSNYGPTVSMLAPGGEQYERTGDMEDQILSTLPQNNYGGMVGTSMAAPFVTGAAALILSVRPDLEPVDILHALLGGANTVAVQPVQHPDMHLRGPLLNTMGALNWAQKLPRK